MKLSSYLTRWDGQHPAPPVRSYKHEQQHQQPTLSTHSRSGSANSDSYAQLWLQAPVCGGCDEAVESTGDGWQCFHCNSYWDYGAHDGEFGAFTDEYPSLDG